MAANLEDDDAGLSKDPEFAARFEEALKEVGDLSWDEPSQISGKLEPAAKKQKIEPAAKKQKSGSKQKVGTSNWKSGTSYSVANSKGVVKGTNGFFQDIIWTPEIAAKQALEKQKDAELARALFDAVDSFGGKPVMVSQLGSDFNVARIKKDAQFKNHKLLDILRYHEDVFELVPDSSSKEGGVKVKLQPGAEAALPDADTFKKDLEEADLLLPERIEEPSNPRERMQALRIELILTLHRRGGKVALQELGMDPKVQKMRSGLQKSLKLIDFIKIFPENFKVTSGDDALMYVERDSVDVFDQTAIYAWDSAREQSTQKWSNWQPSGYAPWPKANNPPKVVPRLYPAK